MKKSFLVIISLLVVSFLLIGCSFSFGMPSAPTQQGESVSEDTGGSTGSDENTGGDTSGSGSTSEEQTSETHIFTVADVKDAIVLPSEAKNVFLSMVNLFFTGEAPVINVGFTTQNHSLWHVHINAQVKQDIPQETFEKAKKILLDMGYPEDLIAMSYGDYGGGIALGRTDKGFSLEIAYDKQGKSLVMGVGLQASDNKPAFGLDFSKLKGSTYWKCVKDVFGKAGIDVSQLKDDEMLSIQPNGALVSVSFIVNNGISTAEVTKVIAAIKSAYGGEYTEIGGAYTLDGAKCKKADISVSGMMKDDKGLFSISVEFPY
ncbi:hypothetical protein GM182_07555 [bacterium 3DAC]|nr:hypothetical protein GM182_07555 [bacterium 3DAC]